MSTRDVTPVTKATQLRRGPPVACACDHPDCPQSGQAKKPFRDGAVHIRRCPCNRCRGRNNRGSGRKKQRAAGKAFGGPATLKARYRGDMAAEERWRGPWRVEVKSGAQVRPVGTAYRRMRAQSDASVAVGDGRPFAAVAMPAGEQGGYVIVRLDDWEQHVAPSYDGGDVA